MLVRGRVGEALGILVAQWGAIKGLHGPDLGSWGMGQVAAILVSIKCGAQVLAEGMGFRVWSVGMRECRRLSMVARDLRALKSWLQRCLSSA